MFVVNCFILRKSLLRIEMYIISIYVYFFLPGYIFKGGCEFLFRLWFLLRQGILLGYHLMGEIDRKSLKETGKCFLNNQSFLNLLCTFDTWCLKKKEERKSSQNTVYLFFSVRITTAQYPVPSVCAKDQMDDWFESLAECLHWNVRKPQKPMPTLIDSPSTNSLTGNSDSSSQQASLQENFF